MGAGGPRGAIPRWRSGMAAVRRYPSSKVRSSREEIPHAQGKRNPSKTVGVARGHQRADTLKPYSQKTSQSNHTRTTALSNSMKLSHACGATQDGRVMVERSDRMWSTGEVNGKPLQYSCLDNPMNSMKSTWITHTEIIKSRLFALISVTLYWLTYLFIYFLREENTFGKPIYYSL